MRKIQIVNVQAGVYGQPTAKMSLSFIHGKRAIPLCIVTDRRLRISYRAVKQRQT